MGSILHFWFRSPIEVNAELWLSEHVGVWSGITAGRWDRDKEKAQHEEKSAY